MCKGKVNRKLLDVHEKLPELNKYKYDDEVFLTGE